MVRFSKSGYGLGSGRAWSGVAAVLALGGLVGCGSGGGSAPTPTPVPTPTATVGAVPPTGCLAQTTPASAITCVTDAEWNVEVMNGVVTIMAPAMTPATGFRYVSNGTAESLGGEAVRNWAGNRRTIMLPGNGKVTMYAAGNQIVRVSIYNGNQSHTIDASAQRIVHSQVNAGFAQARDDDEMDGETAHLQAAQYNNPNFDALFFVNLYGQSGTDGTTQPKIDLIRPLARQMAAGVTLFGALDYAAPAEADTTCGTTPVGGLTRNGDTSLTYVSRSGQYRVHVNEHTISITYGDPGVHTWQHWGHPHENLNGKHIKDWEGTRRTTMLPDGTKITMDSDGPQGVVLTTSIYDGPRSHRISNVGNVVSHSCVNAQVAAQREAEERDGETMYFTILKTATSPIGAALTLNYYDENEGSVGNFRRLYTFELLGQTGEPETNPNNVSDYYDDPRLGHT